MARTTDRFSEVLELSDLLAVRVLDAQAMGRAAPADQIVALAKAARLLQDNGVTWPPLLAQVLQALATGITQRTVEDELRRAIDAASNTSSQVLRFSDFRGRERHP